MGLAGQSEHAVGVSRLGGGAGDDEVCRLNSGSGLTTGPGHHSSIDICQRDRCERVGQRGYVGQRDRQAASTEANFPGN